MLNFKRHGKGPVLVLQHGFLGGSGYFAPQMAAFSQSHDVIAPDLPGFADSADCPDFPLVSTIPDFSRAQILVLDQLGIDRFSLLGHSMGGMVALQTALDYPHRVERLILYATASSGNLPERFETFARTKSRLAQQGLNKTAATVTASWFLEGHKAPMYDFCLAAGKGASIDAVNAALEAFAAWDVTGRLGELKIPVLVVGGDGDRSYSLDSMVALMKAIPGARLGILPQCAHCAHLEKPELFNPLVGNFLSQTS